MRANTFLLVSACSNYEQWLPATKDPDSQGNVTFHVTHTKTRDKYHGDAFVTIKRHVPYVQFYYDKIRSRFLERFLARTEELERDRIQRVTGLFLGPNGRRYQAFETVPLLSNVVTGVHVTVTTLRKLVATWSAKLPKPEEAIMTKADTHSVLTRDRFYKKEESRSHAMGAINLLERSFPNPHVTAIAAAVTPVAPRVAARPRTFTVEELLKSCKVYHAGQKRGRIDDEPDAEMAGSAADDDDAAAPRAESSPSMGAASPHESPAAMSGPVLGPPTKRAKAAHSGEVSSGAMEDDDSNVRQQTTVPAPAATQPVTDVSAGVVAGEVEAQQRAQKLWEDGYIFTFYTAADESKCQRFVYFHGGKQHARMYWSESPKRCPWECKDSMLGLYKIASVVVGKEPKFFGTAAACVPNDCCFSFSDEGGKHTVALEARSVTDRDMFVAGLCYLLHKFGVKYIRVTIPAGVLPGVATAPSATTAAAAPAAAAAGDAASPVHAAAARAAEQHVELVLVSDEDEAGPQLVSSASAPPAPPLASLSLAGIVAAAAARSAARHARGPSAPAAAAAATAAATAATGVLTRRQRRPKPGVIGDGVEVKRSTLGPMAGLGLFATREYNPGDPVTEYDGEVIDHQEAVQRRRVGEGTHIATLESQHTCVDGFGLSAQATGRGGGSFANDGRDKYPANVMFFKDDLKRYEASSGRAGLVSAARLFLMAKTFIPANAEIFLSYGNGYQWPALVAASL